MTFLTPPRIVLRLIRPQFWLKNFFVLWGGTLSCAGTHTPAPSCAWLLFKGTLSACLLSSANYLLNDWTDADSDRFHPLKKKRPCAQGQLSRAAAVRGYWGLTFAALVLAGSVSSRFLLCAVLFLLAGGLYNVRPLRLKDRAGLDIISESAFSPLRVVMGWFIIPGAAAPPAALLSAFWLAAVYFMGMKRSTELNLLGKKNIAGRYRLSLEGYSEQQLTRLSLTAALFSLVLFGVFLKNARPDLLFSLPWTAGLFAWHFLITLRSRPSILISQGLLHNRAFSVYCLIFCLLLQVQTGWLP